MPLSFLPEAIPTAIGWAHPLTGEQLTAGEIPDTELGEDTVVTFYSPNAGEKSFLDPEGETRTLVQFIVRGRTANIRIVSLEEIDSAEWDFDDETTAEGTWVKHAFAAAGTYGVTVSVMFAGAAEAEIFNVEITVV